MSTNIAVTPRSAKYKRRNNITSFEEDPQSVRINFKPTTHARRKTLNDFKYNLDNKPSDYYDFSVQDRKVSINDYNKYLADILINGNMRVKFMPKCATRAGARLYCNSKLDEDGYPRYKLIGTNALDAFGNKICDMNGDQVDDIIICNRDGLPAIINGYKLVPASPYKKVWKNEKAAGHTDMAFDKWLADQFNATKDWSKITEEQWSSGKLGWTLDAAPETAQKAYNLYRDKGLGKPRINNRVSPNAAWSSMFAQFIWQDVVYSFCNNNLLYKLGMKAIDYLKIASAMYIKYVERPVAEIFSQNKNWISWTNYKQSNTKEVRKALGKRVQEIYNYLVENASSEEQRDTLVKQKSGFYYEIHKDTTNLLVDCAGGEEYIKDFGLAVQAGTVTPNDIKEAKSDFRTSVDTYINDDIFPGYAQYILQKNKAKVKPVKNIGDYALMKWKTNDNDDGWDFDEMGDASQL